MNQLQILPQSQFYNVCFFLETKDLKSLNGACKHFRHLLKTDEFYLRFPQWSKLSIEFINSHLPSLTFEHLLHLNKNIKPWMLNPIIETPQNRHNLLIAKLITSLLFHQEMIDHGCHGVHFKDPNDQFDGWHNDYQNPQQKEIVKVYHSSHHLLIWGSDIYRKLIKINFEDIKNKPFESSQILISNDIETSQFQDQTHFYKLYLDTIELLINNFLKLNLLDTNLSRRVFAYFATKSSLKFIVPHRGGGGFDIQEEPVPKGATFPDAVFLGLCDALAKLEIFNILDLKVNNNQLASLCETLKGKKVCKLHLDFEEEDVTIDTLQKLKTCLSTLQLSNDSLFSPMLSKNPYISLILITNLSSENESMKIALFREIDQAFSQNVNPSTVVRGFVENKEEGWIKYRFTFVIPD